MLRIAICDDLKSERDMVKGFLRSFFAAVPYEYTLAEYSRGETMVDDYDDGSVDFDLIFMDIFMDGMLGMEAARCLRRYAPHVSIVFLTTTPAYALESYDVYAYGYLVKPLNGEKTAALLRRFLQEEYEGNQKTLLLKKGCRGRRIAYREIEYIESRRNVLLVFLENGEEYRVYGKTGRCGKGAEGTRIPAVPPELYCEYEPGEGGGGGFPDDVRGPIFLYGSGAAAQSGTRISDICWNGLS